MTWIHRMTNQRGSLPLVMITLMLMTATISSLAVMGTSDRASEISTKRMLQQTLNDDSLYEIIYFEVATRLDNRYFSIDELILSTTDLAEINNAIQQRFQTDYAEYLGDKKTLVKMSLQEEGYSVHDLCTNINTCTFTLNFEFQIGEPNKGIIYSFTDLQWNNVGTLESPIFHLSTFHSKWRITERN